MDALFSGLPLPAAAPDLEYPCGDGAVMLLYRGFDPASFDALTDGFLAAGFARTDRLDRPGTRCALLRRGGLTVSLDLWERELRLIADPFTAPVRLSDPCPVTDKTTVWMHEVDHSFIDCGMCFILRCCDGSFFIVDSGHFLQTNDNDRIYRFLRQRTPAGQKVRIAGWFLSHAHSDHVCKFFDFLRYNMDDCVLETVYCNFPAVRPVQGAGWGRQGECLYARTIGELLDSMPEIRRVKLHTGQHFAVRDLSFTVLCTHEDVFPTENTDFNNTTTVLMMEAAGTRLLFCGDASDAESDIMVPRWGEDLKCDILQVAHHGHHGCSAAFYDLTRADAALFSNTQIFYDLDLVKEKEANETILRHAREVHISSNGTVGADLPYVSFTALPDETFEDFDMIRRLWGYEYSDERKEELYAAYLARGGKDNFPFYRPPTRRSRWMDVE
jgi:beta-lactamase superfamily II metal-dependent hydrolase